jgi:putative glutamine amidotransferase
MTQPLIGISTFKTTATSPRDLPVQALSPSYSNGVAAGGGAPLQIPHGFDEATLRTIFDRLDGVLLSGGGDIDPAFYGEQTAAQVGEVDRERDEQEFLLARWAVQEGKPLFAICRGHQVLNVALGGNLYQDILDEMPGAIRHAFFQSAGFSRDYRPHHVWVTPPTVWLKRSKS